MLTRSEKSAEIKNTLTKEQHPNYKTIQIANNKCNIVCQHKKQ